MEKRVRAHSKGLVEFAQLRPDNEQRQNFDDNPFQDSAWSGKAVVQFVHQTVRDFLTAGGFLYLCDTQPPTWIAKGNEFMKTICLNYLRTKELDTILDIDTRVCEAPWSRFRTNVST